MEQAAILEIKGTIATIHLNRARAMNTYNEAMAESLLAHTESLSFNKEVKVVVLQGNGPAFMAGGDIEFFAEKLPQMPKGIRALIRALANTINNIRHSDQIYVAAVHGAVAGAGMSLMLACDFVIADENTTFTTAYNRLGTSPDGGLSYMLPKLVGDKKAMELLLLSERVTSQEMLRLDLLNQVCEPGGLSEIISSWCKKIIRLPFKSSAYIKNLVHESHNLNFEGQCELEAKYFIDSVQSKDFTKGVHAFLDKRQPNFD